MNMRDIKDLNREELESHLKERGFPGFHSRQIFAWLYEKGAADFDRMSNLPRELREQLKRDFYIFGFSRLETLRSSDGTLKLLFRLRDGNLVEAVSIPERSRVTACLSSQAGCKFACNFCASGLKG